MNKAELITLAAERAGVSRKDAERVLNAALDTLSTALAEGDRVQLTGFGAFDVKVREAHVGRNPRTKELVDIAAKKVPTFKPSQALRDLVDKQ